MSLEYHYSWPCGHMESLGRTAFDTNLRATLEQHNTAQASDPTSSLSLGEPAYPCPTCSDTPEGVRNRIEALTARLDAHRRDSQTDRLRAAAARAQRLRARGRTLTNNAGRGPHAMSRPARTFQEELLAITRRDEQIAHQRLLELQERVIRRAEGRSSPQPAPVVFNPNPVAAEFVPGAATWAPHEATNGVHFVPQTQPLAQRQPSLEQMEYLWAGSGEEAPRTGD